MTEFHFYRTFFLSLKRGQILNDLITRIIYFVIALSTMHLIMPRLADPSAELSLTPYSVGSSDWSRKFALPGESWSLCVLNTGECPASRFVSEIPKYCCSCPRTYQESVWRFLCTRLIRNCDRALCPAQGHILWRNWCQLWTTTWTCQSTRTPRWPTNSSGNVALSERYAELKVGSTGWDPELLWSSFVFHFRVWDLGKR